VGSAAGKACAPVLFSAEDAAQFRRTASALCWWC